MRREGCKVGMVGDASAVETMLFAARLCVPRGPLSPGQGETTTNNLGLHRCACLATLDRHGLAVVKRFTVLVPLSRTRLN